MTVIGQEEEVPSRPFDPRVFGRTLARVRRHRGLAAASLGLTLGIAAAAAVPPYLLGQAVDRGIVARDPGALAWIAGLYLGIEAVRLGILYAQGWAVSLLGQRVALDLRMDLARKVTAQSVAFFGREPAGRIVTRVMNDVQNLADLFSGGALAVIGDIFQICLIAAVMLWLDARLTLLVLAVLPVLSVAAGGLNGRIRDGSREQRRLLARVAAHLAETMSGIRVVHLFTREAASARRFGALNDRHLDAHLRVMRLHALYISTITVVTLGGIALLVWQGGRAVLAGSLELGLFVAFLGYAQALFQPIRDIAEKVAVYLAAMASAERVFRMLDEEVEVRSPAAPRPLPRPVRGEIEFRQVSFAYRGALRQAQGERTVRQAQGERMAALRRVSFRIRPGERVAIVGRTGAGKSTVVNLLGRFYDPDEGAVLVDGVDVREADERDLRRAIGVVLQDVFVFAGSVLENIRLGDPSVGEESARAAAAAARAEPWIRRLPRGFAEEMRERGATLSTGQKQLLSFARALAFDPRVLVLDEATASIDPETEALLQEAVRAVTRGRTSIVIAHRLGTIQDVDRVLVLHGGELKEEGTPKELLARGGLFAKLYRLQFERAH